MSRAREVSKIALSLEGIDLNQLISDLSTLENVIFSSTPPENPSVGTLWTDSTNQQAPALKVYNGNEWISVSSAATAGGMKSILMTIGAS